MASSDEKQCPYCAEMIKAEAIKCRYCGSDLTEKRTTDLNVLLREDQPDSEPSNEPKVAACPSCNVALVTTQKEKTFSAAVFFATIFFLIGIVLLFINFIAGAIVIILALVINMARGKKTVMVCPNCGKEGARIA